MYLPNGGFRGLGRVQEKNNSDGIFITEVLTPPPTQYHISYHIITILIFFSELSLIVCIFTLFVCEKCNLMAPYFMFQT